MKPMLATAGPLPHGPDWVYEMKWDGVRALVNVDTAGIRISSRRGNDITVAYPELAPLARQIPNGLLDGEIVAFADGKPSFAALQSRMHVRSATQASRLTAAIPVHLLIFDILRLEDMDLRILPLIQRRTLLETLELDGPHWTASPLFDDDEATAQASHEYGLEGVIAKRKSSLYHPGVRTKDWIKVRFSAEQEFVVGGWQHGEGNRINNIGALLLGYYDNDRLEYAGQVGTGFTLRTLDALLARLAPLQRSTSPFATALSRQDQRNVVWCEPQMVVQVSFASWTRDRRLRFPIYEGLRDDKDPRDVTRE